jgi:uncharacterized membrane protein YvbJ
MAYTKCKNCGNSLTADDRYCQQCGENNSKFVSEVSNEASKNKEIIESSSTGQRQTYAARPQEGQGIGWFVLGLMIPLVGFILYFSFKPDKPNSSSMSLSGAIIGSVIGAIFWF